MSTQLNNDLNKFESQEIKLFDRIFRDSEGKIVIAQPPNLPLIVGVLATVLHLFLSSGNFGALLGLVGFGALFTWAWLELFEGVNYFRRGLGLIGLLGLILLNLNLIGV